MKISNLMMVIVFSQLIGQGFTESNVPCNELWRSCSTCKNDTPCFCELTNKNVVIPCVKTANVSQLEFYNSKLKSYVCRPQQISSEVITLSEATLFTGFTTVKCVKTEMSHCVCFAKPNELNKDRQCVQKAPSRSKDPFPEITPNYASCIKEIYFGLSPDVVFFGLGSFVVCQLVIILVLIVLLRRASKRVQSSTSNQSAKMYNTGVNSAQKFNEDDYVVVEKSLESPSAPDPWNAETYQEPKTGVTSHIQLETLEYALPASKGPQQQFLREPNNDHSFVDYSRDSIYQTRM